MHKAAPGGEPDPALMREKNQNHYDVLNRRKPAHFNSRRPRLVRDKYIAGRSAEALALYLFLVTVADSQGLSYYSDAGIGKLLPLDESALARARQELVRARLIAYDKPLYQVLSLDKPVPRSGQSQSLGEILRQMRLPT
jgi:hypothetical protein